jgi:hypothetical protein
MLSSQTLIYKHTKGGTLYLSIASKMAADSNFPFKPGDLVEVDCDAKNEELRVRKVKKK